MCYPNVYAEILKALEMFLRRRPNYGNLISEDLVIRLSRNKLLKILAV